PPPLTAFRSWMLEALRETLPQQDHRCREGIGDHSRNLECPDQRSLDAHAQRCHAQQQDLHSSLLTQVARYSPYDGIDEQEEPFHQEVAGERLVPGRPALLLWRSSKAKRAEGDTHEEGQHRDQGAYQQPTISLNHAQSNEQEVARHKRGEHATQREVG